MKTNKNISDDKEDVLVTGEEEDSAKENSSLTHNIVPQQNALSADRSSLSRKRKATELDIGKETGGGDKDILCIPIDIDDKEEIEEKEALEEHASKKFKGNPDIKDGGESNGNNKNNNNNNDNEEHNTWL